VGAETRRRVLIIDNNEDVLATLDRELKEAGYDTVTTWSGVEALRLLNSHTFDSLLVDDYLPDLYIGDFLERVSRLPVRPRILVMQVKPGKNAHLSESRGAWSLVDKRQIAALITVLDADPGWIQ
jgi:CheY-like chemotaxis protein